DGAQVTVGSASFTALTPTVLDKVAAIERRAQIVVPSDAALIALHADVKAGDLVVEGGAGSGALSIVLLHLLRPGGRLVTYEVREDHAEVTRANVERAGLAEGHEIRLGDVASDIREEDVDAIVLDIPEPWRAVPACRDALRTGGRLVSYVPTVGQVERTHDALTEAGFREVRTFETLERELVVGRGGTRPSFEMLGHTGYTTVARKMSG
ncbi:MAG: methyltransferase, partial [Thermoplasmata archaeon]|nr:methyltransferase [Thermoplasmata archaeon]NIS13538.1 methyltransferase [Thermoplasmata archaeon]NIS21409.1 methyltransferase [Thermoplasmata archaeon]NIT78960.1 methyltransferase [Thermoplasmata archaeon]NIU50462.1 methyltransferase [Thermoplasmata archaeon]